MSRGRFHLFSTRSALPYAQRVVSQLEDIVESQSDGLGTSEEKSLTDEQRLEFLKEVRESRLHVGDVRVQHFRDGEMNADLGSENVRDRDVFLFQAPYTTTNGRTLSENLFETFVLADALNHAKAKSVTLVSLYYPYGRGDKQHGKDGIPAAMYANMLSTAGVNGVVTFDLHTDQIAGFFPQDKMNVEHLRALPLLIDYIRTHIGEGSVCAPDAGAGKRAQYFARELGADVTLGYKRRSYRTDHAVDELRLLGSPERDLVFIVDDMIATGGSMVKLMDLLGQEKGVKRAYAVATHPLLIDPAVEVFDRLYEDPEHPFAGIVTTDSIPHSDGITSKPWYRSVDTSRFIARALYEIHTSGTLTPLHSPGCVEELGLRVSERSRFS